MTVGERIAARRKELHMTQEELAQKLGYKTKSSINKIERDASGVPMDRVEDIAEALQCDAGYLMGWERTRTPVMREDDLWYMTSEEVELLRCWREATDTERENIAFLLREHNMPKPKPAKQDQSKSRNNRNRKNG